MAPDVDGRERNSDGSRADHPLFGTSPRGSRRKKGAGRTAPIWDPTAGPWTASGGTSSWRLGRLGRSLGLARRGRLGGCLAFSGRPILGGLLRLVLLGFGV